MPLRHQVPTLKHLAIRIVCWPDGVYRSVEEEYPNPYSRRHALNLISTLARKGVVGLNIFPKKIALMARASVESEQELVTENLVEEVVNAWIRLTTFYNTRLDEIDQIELFFRVGHERIKSLDFLFEEFWSRDGRNLRKYCGVIPYTLPPKRVDPFTWKAIMQVLTRSGLDEKLESLSMYLVGKTRTGTTDETVFQFAKTINGFRALKRLVVHGDANDALMAAVGESCPLLEYLDIRETNVTEKGILFLIFKNANIIRRIRNSDVVYTFPQNALNPLTSTLKYLDMSTMPFKGLLLDRDRAVKFACRHLVPTPRRFFFWPGGMPRLHCPLDLKLVLFRSKVITILKTALVDLYLELSRDLWCCLSQGYSHAEVRVNTKGDVVSFNFYNLDYLVIHLKVESCILVEFTVYSVNACDFIPLELIQNLLPNLKHLKASLKGVVDVGGLPNLTTAACTMVFGRNTLISLVRNCVQLQYLEVRELFQAEDYLGDEDVKLMMREGPPSLEIIRFLFNNSITLQGIKVMCLNSPQLKFIGDLKHWSPTQITLPIIIKLKYSMNCHNFEFVIEYDGISYSTKKPCRELEDVPPNL